MIAFIFAFISLITPYSSENDTLTTIPFKMVGEHMYFEMSVNGQENLQFIFDTGANATVLSHETVKKLGVKTTGSETAQGASGSTQVFIAGNNNIEFGGLNLDDVDFYVVNIDHLKPFNQQLDGIIGAAMLNSYIIEFDYDDEVMRLYNPEHFNAPEHWQKESFVFEEYGIPIIEATVSLPSGTTYTGRYLVDTGAGLSLKFNTPFVKETNLSKALGINSTYQTQALSSSSATDILSTVPGFEVFGHTFTNFTARLSQGNSGVSALEEFHGILGHTILKRFNAIYDYKNETMYLKPNKLYSSEF